MNNTLSKITFLTIFSLLVSCQNPVNDLKNNQKINTSTQINKLSIKGSVEFDEMKFSKKATLAEIGNRSTISLIYPSNNPTKPNQTINTGLTDQNGNFVLNLNSDFLPNEGDIFVLEASKRIGNTGDAKMSIRTYVKWNNNLGWESISFTDYSGVRINTRTTAISIIDDYDNQINPIDTINKLDYSKNVLVINNINSVSSDLINNVANKVNLLLSQSVDPVRYIKFENGDYVYNKELNHSISVLNSTNKCPNCNLSGEVLSNKDYSNSDLRNADFSNSDLTNTNFTNANLAGANFTNANLSNSIMTNSNLSNVNFTNSNLNFSVLKGANILNANFTKATLNNAHFVDYSFCSPFSLGNCADTALYSKEQIRKDSPLIVKDKFDNFTILYTGIKPIILESSSIFSESIYSQKFDKNGLKLNETKLSNDYLGDYYPENNLIPYSFSMNPDGNFVASWNFKYSDTFANIYDNNRNSVNNPILIGSSNAPSLIAGSSLAINSDNSFISTSTQYSTNYTTSDIIAKKYSPTGAIQQSDLQVNTYITGKQEASQIAMDSNGNFVITWQSNNQDGSGSGIYAQKYNNQIQKIGSEFKVNTYTTSDQYNPKMAMDSTGNFIVTWQSYTQDGSGSGIYAQRYNNQGQSIGTEFRVNSTITSHQVNPSISINQNGNFVISWEKSNYSHNYILGPTSSDLYIQRYNNQGQAIGTETKVNQIIAPFKSSSVLINSENNVIVTWGGGLSFSNSYFRRYKFD